MKKIRYNVKGNSKILVAFYSRTCNTKKIAEEIAFNLKSDIDDILDLKSRVGFFGFISSFWDSMRKKETRIMQDINPENYKLVIIGTPVWNQLTPAIRTYIKQNKNKLKNVKLAFFCTCYSKSNGLFDEMERVADKKPIAEISFTEEDIKNNYKEKVKNFCKELKKKL